MKDIDMKLTTVCGGIPVIEIDDIFDSSIQDQVWNMVNAFDPSALTRNPFATGGGGMGEEEWGGLSSEELHGTMNAAVRRTEKTLSGVWLDCFVDQQNGIIHSPAMKSIGQTIRDLKPQLMELHPHLRTLHMDRNRGDLLSYYGTGDEYPPHADATHITVLYWFCKDESKFDGGDLNLHSFDGEKEYTIPYQNNKMILFPGYLMHSVDPVKNVSLEDWKAGYGRWCWSIFLG